MNQTNVGQLAKIIDDIVNARTTVASMGLGSTSAALLDVQRDLESRLSSLLLEQFRKDRGSTR